MKLYFRLISALLVMVAVFLLLPQQISAAGQQYTVTYDANGGKGAPDAQTQEKGAALILSEQTPYYNGYFFKGWSTTRYGDLAYQPADNYTANEDVTLFAVWAADCYNCIDGRTTVTCNKCGGRGSRIVVFSSCHDYAVAETIGQYGTMFYQCKWCWYICSVYKEQRNCETTETVSCTKCNGKGWNKTSAPAAPKPELQEVTTGSITVVAQPGMQYSIDKINWSKNNTFEGLDAESEYIIYQRYAPSDMYYAGEASEGLTVTTEALPTSPPEQETEDSGNTETEPGPCWYHSYELYTGNAQQHIWSCYVCGYTEMEDHVYRYACASKCDTCGKTRSVTHSLSSDWSRDRDYHWRWCTKCDNALNDAEHTPGAAATETKPQTCTVCGYVIKPALRHTHSYAESWTADKTGHWYACSGCSEADSFAEHTPGPEATEDTDQTCTVCDYVIQTAQGHTHSFAANWMADKTGHWHACSGCEERSSYASHAPGPEATADTDQICTVCGKTLAQATGETTSPPETTAPATQLGSDTGDSGETDTPEKSRFPWWVVVITAIVAAATSGAAVFVVIQKQKREDEKTSPG